MTAVPLIYAGPFSRVSRTQQANPGLYMRGWAYRGRDTIDGQIKTYKGGVISLRGGAPIARPVWLDSYGKYRVGHTGDMVQMLADLGVNDRAG